MAIPKLPQKDCIICEEKFWPKDRGVNVITCTKRCARIYKRVADYVAQRARRNIKQKFHDYWDSLS